MITHWPWVRLHITAGEQSSPSPCAQQITELGYQQVGGAVLREHRVSVLVRFRTRVRLDVATGKKACPSTFGERHCCKPQWLCSEARG